MKIYREKKVYILVFIFLISSNLYSQKATMSTQKVYSENQQYQVQVRGLYYEGFVSDQKISFINADNDTLWQQVVPSRFLILPAVSNIGDVAITHREIKIYDKFNRLKGAYPFKKKESPFNWGDYEGTVHGFSIKGDRYFIFMFTGTPDHAFICFSDSAKELWRLNVGDYCPAEMMFYQNKVIVDDFSYSSVNYINCCYVFDLDGAILWQYKADIKNLSFSEVIFDKKTGILTTKKDKMTGTKVKLDTLITPK